MVIRYYIRLVGILLLCFYFSKISEAQCPVNIGFEEGSFNNWECFSGRVDSLGEVNVFATPPNPMRHALKQNSFPQEIDPFGLFPVNCPNGSGYSIMLGNEETGAQAERVSYTFTIPAGEDIYSMIYNYAVVFQNPGHSPYQQPRFTAKVFDVTSNRYIDCSSFEYAASSHLPGFKQVPGTDIFYKPWSPVTIKLLGYGGKTIRVEFTTNDCTRGGHFGYAYLDIDEDCTSPIKGNVYCVGSSSIDLTAPYGFQEYHWYDSSFTQLMGTENILKLNPPPAAGTKYALELIPFPGGGCVDTLYTTIAYAPVPFNFKLADSTGSCIPLTADLTNPSLIQGSTPGLNYGYFLDSSLKERISTPAHIDTSGTYYIQASNSYGCIATKPIKVIISDKPNIRFKDPSAVYYPGTVDITDPALAIGELQDLHLTYWQNTAATIPVQTPNKLNVAGIYFIKATNAIGCSSINAVNVTITPPPPPNAFSPNNDGINDVWKITGLQPYPGCTVNVYTRFGQLVFESVGYRKPWDGTFNGKPLPIGTYYYVINVSPLLKRMSGSVTILK